MTSDPHFQRHERPRGWFFLGPASEERSVIIWTVCMKQGRGDEGGSLTHGITLINVSTSFDDFALVGGRCCDWRHVHGSANLLAYVQHT